MYYFSQWEQLGILTTFLEDVIFCILCRFDSFITLARFNILDYFFLFVPYLETSVNEEIKANPVQVSGFITRNFPSIFEI